MNPSINSGICPTHAILSTPHLSASVTAVDTQIGTYEDISTNKSRNSQGPLTGDVGTGITEKESDGTHEVLWTTHLTLGDKAGPLLCELWVVVQNLLGTERC